MYTLHSTHKQDDICRIERSRAGLPADRDAEQLGTQSTLTGRKGRTILATFTSSFGETRHWPPSAHSLSASCAPSLSAPPRPPSACHSLLTPRPSLLPSLSRSLSLPLHLPSLSAELCVQPGAGRPCESLLRLAVLQGHSRFPARTVKSCSPKTRGCAGF